MSEDDSEIESLSQEFLNSTLEESELEEEVQSGSENANESKFL